MGFDIHQDLFDSNGDFSEKKVDRYREKLVELFEKSPEGLALTAEGVVLHWADTLIEFGLRYLGLTPPELTKPDLENILFDLIPAKVMTMPDEAPIIIQEMHAFWTFAHRAFGLPNAQGFIKMLDDKTTRKFQNALGNPAKFGISKSIFMMGMERGFDMTTEQGIGEWMETYNAEIRAGTGLPVPLPGERGKQAARARQKMKRKMQMESRKRNRKKK
jgi:hypothetical protein